MSEQTAIDKAKQPQTVPSLIRDFKALGLAKGDTVLVHASLSSMGWVCGGQAAVITALLDVLGENGTLVMPAHTAENSDPAEWRHPPVPADWIDTIRQEMPAFDKHNTPTRGMGAIAECFRSWQGTVRSDHPHVSFCANGKEAERIVSTHVLTPFFGMDTPLGALYQQNARILLLGVGYERCTAFHLAEALSETLPKVQMGCAMMENGKRVWKWFEDYDYDGDDFEKIGRLYEQKHPIGLGLVGCAECRLLDFQPAVGFAKEWITENAMQTGM